MSRALPVALTGSERRKALSSTSLSIVAISALLAIGTIVYALHAGFPLRYLDEHEYLAIAKSVADGDGFTLNGHPTARRPPAWPLVLSFFVAIGVPDHLLLIVPAALMIAGAVCAGLIARRLTGSPWGLLAIPLTIVYPLNLYTAGTLYPQALATAALLFLWLLATPYKDRAGQHGLDRCEPTRPGEGRAVLAGLAAATVTLAVPTLAFSAAVIGLWMIWRTSLRFALTLVVSAAVPLCWWAIRNVVVMGSFIPLSTTSGENLLIGNNPTATADSGTAVGIGHIRQQTAGMDEVARDNFFKTQATQWITDHPGHALELFVQKTLNYFNPYNAPVTGGQSSHVQMAVAYLTFGLLFVFVIARVVLRSRLRVRQSEWLFMALFVVNAPIMAVFFTRTRFRQPLDATLVVVATIGLILVITVIHQRMVARRHTDDSRDAAPISANQP